MQVLVSVDMEGIAGVVRPDEIRPGHPEHERSSRTCCPGRSAGGPNCCAAPNGRSLGELGLNTALAAHHGVQPTCGRTRPT
jgi:D-aminopeptidase